MRAADHPRCLLPLTIHQILGGLFVRGRGLGCESALAAQARLVSLVHHVVSPWLAILASCRRLGGDIRRPAAPPAGALLGRRGSCVGILRGIAGTAPLPAPSSTVAFLCRIKVRTFLQFFVLGYPVLFQMPAVLFQMPADCLISSVTLSSRSHCHLKVLQQVFYARIVPIPDQVRGSRPKNTLLNMFRMYRRIIAVQGAPIGYAS